MASYYFILFDYSDWYKKQMFGREEGMNYLVFNGSRRTSIKKQDR